jgi:hypothetical protein
MNVNLKGTFKDSDYEHFTRVDTSSQDRLAGDTVAYLIGDTYIDSHKMSPVDQWTQIMKALRVYGISISFKEQQ